MWAFLIERIRFSLLLILTIVLVGFASLSSMPREATPEVKVPYASVLTVYAGASPVDVEELITDPLEATILNLDELVSVESVSAEGVSSIFVEFETDADLDDRVSALQDAVNQVESQLPEDVSDPIVSELSFDNAPILTISLSADLSHSELVSIAEEVESEILDVSGVSDVDIIGVREEQIQVNVDPAKLEQYDISILEIFQVIQTADSNTPLGSIEANDSQFTLRFSADLAVEEIEYLIVRSVEGTPIFVRDLAEVSFELEDAHSYSRVSLDGSTSQDSISMNVYKKTGSDIVGIVDEINARIELMKGDVLAGITIFTPVDSAEDIRDQLNDLSWSGFQTIFLVALVLFLSLGFREALVAGLSIPLTFLISFTGLAVVGETFNFLSLFSLILALGILVDTGVVVTEGMHTRLKEGLSPKEIALATVREYQWPLISGTLTTVAAFAPMLLMTGIIGEFVKHIPVTVSITLIASLFVGLGLLPVIGSRLLKIKHHKRSFLERRIDGFKSTYRQLMEYFLERKRRQSWLIFGMIVCFFMSLSLPITGALQVVMFPQVDYRVFFIEVELPKGSLLEETNDIAVQIESILLETPEVESFVVSVGSSGTSGDALSQGSNSVNLANFTINLYEDRERSSLEIIEDYRLKMSEIDNADIDVIGVSDGPPSASPIEFRIVGPDLDVLKAYSDEAVAHLESTEGAVNVRSSLDEGVSELILSVDRQKLASMGLDPSTLAQLARIAIDGFSVTTLKLGGDDVDVVLQTTVDHSLSEILALPITTSYGTQSLSYFVDVEFGNAPTTIIHRDGDRTVTVTSDLETGYYPAAVLADFQSQLELDLGTDYRIEYGGESDEMAESFASLGRAMLLGLLLIITILILQFNSFRQAAIILFTIPLALIGVFLGLTLLGLPFSFPAFIGVVALAGIVVNNAIILIDRINKNRAEGLEKDIAILEAGVARFQPIILTSITTIIGIFPLAMSDPTWGPLGFTIISGLMFSTLLTLVVIPSTYQRFL